jgi:translation initiation factor IF-2
MSDVSVKQLAEVVGTPVERLLEQMKEAGVKVSGADQMISDEEKMKLLEYLRQAHGKTDTGKKKITLRRKKTTEIKVPSGGAAGRTKAVNVEIRKKRTIVRPTETEAQTAAPAAEQAAVARPVSKVEQLARQAEAERKALEETARARKEAENAKLHEKELKEAEKEAEEAERLKAEREAEEEAARRKAEEEAARLKTSEEEERKKAEEAAREAEVAREVVEIKGGDTGKAKGKKKGKGRGEEADQETRYGRKELHVTTGKQGRRTKPGRGRPEPVSAAGKHGFAMPTEPVVKEVAVPENITVGDLAKEMAVKAPELIKVMMGMGVMATINQVLDQDTAMLVVEEMGHKAYQKQATDAEAVLTAEVEAVVDERERKPRSPVVTIMGHVDHGKTSLLDYIRSTKVTAGEAGGITQHIGAYHIDSVPGGITFLDTPGHAAFTSMRARGAKVTDIVIIVVAADDSVKPQTVEAIKHAKAAEVPIIIAVNKMDKPEADPERVKSDMSQYEVLPEDWGGDVQFIPVSAHTGQGVDDLLEAIHLQAELLELTAPDYGAVSGTVIESALDKGRGPVATILVQSGKLKRGDIVLSGREFGRVRAMFNEKGEQVDEAGPSIPVVVLGLSGVPDAGDDVITVANEKKAREVADLREAKQRETKLAAQQAAKLENMFTQMREGEVPTINVLLKSDVQGSAEALTDALNKLSTDEVRVKVVSSGVGGINESDVQLALASGAAVIGFNVRADATAKRLAQYEEVDLRYYSVIYDVIEDVRKAMSGMLSPEVREEIIGLAEVKDVFKSSAFGAVAGCIVTDGVVKRGNPIRVLRDNVVIFEGELESLRRFKDDVNEVQSGTECGIAVKHYNDIKPGDQIENFERTEVAREL